MFQGEGNAQDLKVVCYYLNSRTKSSLLASILVPSVLVFIKILLFICCSFWRITYRENIFWHWRKTKNMYHWIQNICEALKIILYIWWCRHRVQKQSLCKIRYHQTKPLDVLFPIQKISPLVASCTPGHHLSLELWDHRLPQSSPTVTPIFYYHIVIASCQLCLSLGVCGSSVCSTQESSELVLCVGTSL